MATPPAAASPAAASSGADTPADGADAADGGGRARASGRLARGVWSLLLRLLLLRAAATIVVTYSGAVRLAGACRRGWRGASARLERWLSLDADLSERLQYVRCYWWARLRWPIRILALLAALVVAWRHPWRAYAVVVIGVSAGGTYLTPGMPWEAHVTQPQVAGLGGALCFFCWLLPYTSAWLVGIALGSSSCTSRYARGAARLDPATARLGRRPRRPSAQVPFGLGGAAVLVCFSYFPNITWGILAFAAWVLFLLILPKLCLAHRVRDVDLLLPVRLLLGTRGDRGGALRLQPARARLAAHHRAGAALVLPGRCRLPFGVALLWLLFPLLQAMKIYLLKAIENPYGVPPERPPEKLKAPEEAVEVALGGGSHYAVLNSHRAATSAELKACYKRMALLLHPDKNPSEKAPVAFKRVQDAWDALSSPYSRAEYDADVDNGGSASGAAAEEGAADGVAEVEPVMKPEHMPSGPPGLKKRKAPRRR